MGILTNFYNEEYEIFKEIKQSLVHKNIENIRKESRKTRFVSHHHHFIQCIPLIEKLWIGFREGRTATTYTHKGECSQRSPTARER